MRNRLALLLLFTLAAPMLFAANGSDSFYENLVAKGKAQFRANELVDAEQNLRIGAFGMLSDPQSLADALVWLTLAQNAAHHDADARATAARILDIQQKFAAYERARIEPEIRRQFESLLPQLLSQSAATSLHTTPSAAAPSVPPRPVEPLPSTAAQPVHPAEVPPSTPAPAPAQDPVAQARAAASRNDLTEVVRWSTRALESQPDNMDALALRAHARTMLGQWTAALADLSRIPESSLAARGELLADRFVALVGLAQWPQASSALRDVPASMQQRVDVIASRQKLSRATPAPAPSAAPAQPAVSTATPPRTEETPARPAAVQSQSLVPRQAGEPLTAWVSRAANVYQSTTPSQPWTVQFQTVCQASSIESAASRAKGMVWFVPMTMGGRSCYRLLWGHYATEADARRGASTIPSALTAGSKPVAVDARAFTGR